ncbi:MAG: family 43 glycosylhydrolase [Bacillota bacterium]|nr:family 43 glycosylhydrolase [Bacillota bacterium]
MKKLAFNPYLPSYEYIPDAEPHLFGDRVYIYGSHDRFDGISFCLNDYVCYSAPLDDLGDWRYEGVIWKRLEDPHYAPGFHNAMWAPDVVVGPDGRYYLYYFTGHQGHIYVAVCDTPAGHYSYYGAVHYPDGTLIGDRGEGEMFDPGLFKDDDGQVYLYVGFGHRKPKSEAIKAKGPHGAMGFKLADDMLTVPDDDFTLIGVPCADECDGSGYPREHSFFEASSMRKFKGTYYFIYSSESGHELCYAKSKSPLGPFSYGGVLVSIGDIGLGEHKDVKTASDFTGNTHGSIIELNGEYYVFCHRQTNKKQFSRQGCAEKIKMDHNGDFIQAERTSCGLNDGPLPDSGEYEARIACSLMAKNGNRFYMVFKGHHPKEPCFTQTGKDREDNPDQYIHNIHDGDKIGFKYFRFENANRILLKLKGSGRGYFSITQSEDGIELGRLEVAPSDDYLYFPGDARFEKGIKALYLTYHGRGAVDFSHFILEHR